jgi:hypothetical protein
MDQYHRLAHVVGLRRVLLSAVCVCDCAPAYKLGRYLSASTPPSSRSDSSDGYGGDLTLARPPRPTWHSQWGTRYTSRADSLPVSRRARPTCRWPLQSAAPIRKRVRLLGLPQIRRPTPFLPKPNLCRVKPTRTLPPNPAAASMVIRIPIAEAKRSVFRMEGSLGCIRITATGDEPLCLLFLASLTHLWILVLHCGARHLLPPRRPRFRLLSCRFVSILLRLCVLPASFFPPAARLPGQCHLPYTEPTFHAVSLKWRERDPNRSRGG